MDRGYTANEAQQAQTIASVPESKESIIVTTDALAQEVSAVADRLALLEDRLGPVLLPASPREAPDEAVQGSPYRRSLCDHIGTLYGIRSRIEGLLDRLDL